MSEARKQEIALRDKRHLLSDLAFPVSDDLYGYEKAITAAGVKVLSFEQFGSYQGEWWAQIAFPNGEVYFINGYYGSCSGCDAFEAEFGWNADEHHDYLHRLRDFGREYLSNCHTYEQAIAEASRNLEWDTDAEEMVAWIKGRGQNERQIHLGRQDTSRLQRSNDLGKVDGNGKSPRRQ